MLRDLKDKGIASIVEVIVTAVVFVIAAAGILSTVAMFRPQGKEASQKIEAAYIGKGIIDDLRRQVNAEDWDNLGSNLAVGTYSATFGVYNIDYIITEPTSGIRYLVMNITFPDL
jgi:type II secretory pathway pseudopilin PulG